MRRDDGKRCGVRVRRDGGHRLGQVCAEMVVKGWGKCAQRWRSKVGVSVRRDGGQRCGVRVRRDGGQRCDVRVRRDDGQRCAVRVPLRC